MSDKWARKKFTLFAVLVISAVCGLTVNTINLHVADKAQQTVKGITIFSPDNEYYLDPVENYLQGLGWRRSPPVGNGSYFRRTPGYSLIYLAARSFLSEPHALTAMKMLQFILFLSSVYCVFKILEDLNAHWLTVFLGALIYGCTPFFSSYTFFTITEGISPFLVVFAFYFLVRARKLTNKKQFVYLIIASFLLGYAVLTRPYLGLLLPLLPFSMFAMSSTYPIGRRIVLMISTLIFPVAMILTWAARNYYVTHEVIFLEKANHPQSLDRMKPEFTAFWNFTKCWAEDGSKMNSYQLPFYFAALRGDTSAHYVDNILNHVPDAVKFELGSEPIKAAIKNYQQVIFSQRVFFEKQLPMPNEYSESQLHVARQFNELSQRWRANHLVQYYIKNPLKYLADITLHSNTSNLVIFQPPFRETWPIINWVRLGLAVIHVLIYVLLALGLFFFKGDRLIYAYFVILPITFLAFFVFYFQAIEQRYMLPVLPLILLGATMTLERICYSLIRKLG